MQYLVSVIDDKTGSATPDEMVAIDAFNDPLRDGRPTSSRCLKLLWLSCV